ncbi:hypothetical protein FS749_006876 [Ceratobasidium sp. UAMH 11750]|nr:hypothetical protein FS749_006876 [Ceratobasidium sp. UAMH 11750]
MAIIEATALPPFAHIADTPAFQGNLEAQTAYQRLLPLECDNQVKIRLLGWMLIHAPCPSGRSDVARSINMCASDQKILELAEDHLNYFVHAFSTAPAKSSKTPSSHPSRESVDERRRCIMEGLVPPPQDHSAAKEQALVRDNCRCVVTGAVDAKLLARSRHLRQTVPLDYAPGLKNTQCSHILPAHITRGVNKRPGKSDYAAAVMAILESYGGININELNGKNMHRLENVLTLQVGLHDAFDTLQVWFVPLEGEENRYAVEKQDSRMWRELPEEISFVSTSDHLPLPSRQYLATRAACARVLHLSGAAEVIDQVLDDREHVKVLAEDGSSAKLLEYLLFGAEVMAH